MMPPRPRFTLPMLQRAALKIVDQRGLPALSMRTLAAELGAGPMTLYNYVRSREALDGLVVEAIMAEAAWPESLGDWPADVAAVATATWKAVRAHPNAIPLILTRRSLHEATLEPAEALLRALAGSGRSDAELLGAFRAVQGYIMGFAQTRLVGSAETGDGQAKDETAERVKALSAERFPKLVEIATAAERMGLEQEFQAGLAVVMAGLART